MGETPQRFLRSFWRSGLFSGMLVSAGHAGLVVDGGEGCSHPSPLSVSRRLVDDRGRGSSMVPSHKLLWWSKIAWRGVCVATAEDGRSKHYIGPACAGPGIGGPQIGGDLGLGQAPSPSSTSVWRPTVPRRLGC